MRALWTPATVELLTGSLRADHKRFVALDSISSSNAFSTSASYHPFDASIRANADGRGAPYTTSLMLPTNDCDECRPSYLQRRQLASFPPSTIAFSSLPFVFTFFLVATLVSQRLLPFLAAHGTPNKQEHGLPTFNGRTLDARKCASRTCMQITAKRVAATACAATIALSAVLVELILCEISNTLNPAARGLALRTTLYSLLLLIVVIMPALEINSVFNAWFKTSSEVTSTGRKPGVAGVKHMLKALVFGAWLVAFWCLPQTSLLAASLQQVPDATLDQQDFVEASLERIGIIGISLMASLAGFAAVSSIWQTFGVKHRLVRESDIARKETSLTASREMLAAKQSRLRALQRKVTDQPADKGFFSRVVGSVRGNSDTSEMRALEMEIAGLESMSLSLSVSVSDLRSRHASQQNTHSLVGRMSNAFGFTFAVYCFYRIGATSLSSMRRWWQPSSTFATSDPINNILALMTTHYDPSLDRAAWARQFSFALSGVMLLLSFNAVLQSFRLFSRFAPGMVQHAQTSLPLIVSQIAGTYVISSALLLRSNLPEEVSSVITEALGSGLDARFVETWFESWFLVAVGLTATGILVSRKVGSSDADEWEDGDVEMGKMS